MLAPAKHRFSVREYYRMAEVGVLPPGARVELLNGEITDQPSISPFHGGVTTYLNQIFSGASKGRWLVSVQNPVRLDDYSEPQPDLVLLKPAADFYRSRHPQPEDVFLLVEVSDSTLSRDLLEKLPAYGRAGIGEIWIVNLNYETVEVFREPHIRGYGAKMVLSAGDHAKVGAFPDLSVDVAVLLKR